MNFLERVSVDNDSQNDGQKQCGQDNETHEEKQGSLNLPQRRKVPDLEVPDRRVPRQCRRPAATGPSERHTYYYYYYYYYYYSYNYYYYYYYDYYYYYNNYY